MWPFVWITFMVGLIVATIVVAMREKKARQKAMAKMQPTSLDAGLEPGEDPMEAEDGFGAEVDPDESPADLDPAEFK